MLEDIIVLVALAILLLALVWLLARMVNALRLQRAWVRGWGELAQQYGMRFNSGYTRCSVTGMYRGRIVQMLGTFRAGMALQVTTTNYASNTLVMKANPLPPSLRAPDDLALFDRGFTSSSGSQEFLERLFLFARPAQAPGAAGAHPRVGDQPERRGAQPDHAAPVHAMRRFAGLPGWIERPGSGYRSDPLRPSPEHKQQPRDLPARLFFLIRKMTPCMGALFSRTTSCP